MPETLTEDQRKAEDTARHEARVAVLKMIAHATNQNNSGSVKAFAEAYAALCTMPSVVKPYERPAPTAIPGELVRHG